MAVGLTVDDKLLVVKNIVLTCGVAESAIEHSLGVDHCGHLLEDHREKVLHEVDVHAEELAVDVVAEFSF